MHNPGLTFLRHVSRSRGPTKLEEIWLVVRQTRFSKAGDIKSLDVPTFLLPFLIIVLTILDNVLDFLPPDRVVSHHSSIFRSFAGFLPTALALSSTSASAQLEQPVNQSSFQPRFAHSRPPLSLLSHSFPPSSPSFSLLDLYFLPALRSSKPYAVPGEGPTLTHPFPSGGGWGILGGSATYTFVTLLGMSARSFI